MDDMAHERNSDLRDQGMLALAAEIADDYAMLVMDPSGRVQSMNPGAQKILCYTPEEFIGLSADIIFTPEDLARNEAELERARALGDGRAEDERWHLRKDGTRFWGSGVLTALPEGAGFIKIMRDLTVRRAAEDALRASEERFRTLTTSIPQLVFTCREDGWRTWGSPQWVIYTGLSDKDSRGFGWLEAVHPDDRDRTISLWREAMNGGTYLAEHRIRRAKDTEYRWHQTRAHPLPHGNDEAREWVGASSDIHQLRALKESQHVLLAELQHRTRNLLAMVQSIIERSSRSATSIPGFVTDLTDRLRALSRAESIAPTAEQGAVDIRSLIQAELEAHIPKVQSASRVSVEGPSLKIPAESAQPLMLALHELATNAVKYGALSQEEAHLDIRWHIEQEEDEPEVVLQWQERSVQMPPEEQRRRRGYGTELIERALPYQLSAETKLEFGADGVRCVVRVPTAVQREV
jgi:PAS domain S-box-containing protein